MNKQNDGLQKLKLNGEETRDSRHPLFSGGGGDQGGRGRGGVRRFWKKKGVGDFEKLAGVNLRWAGWEWIS